jgi:iron(II)-dependent oxidoreductase
MAGNVAEWVADWYEPTYHSEAALDNPRGPGTGTRRVFRGGSWLSADPKELRTTARASEEPGAQAEDIGVRCVADRLDDAR